MAELLERVRTALAAHYAVEREIGRGGMATVLLARDLKHPRRVAIKVLHPELAAAVGPERFLREIEILSGFTHPHILPLLDSGQAGDLLYYVMPFVEGESLRQRLAREKQLPLADAIEIARDVAHALEYAHGRGILHRDIKPENVLLEEGEAVVADFGIARAVQAAGGPALTETGMLVGTPAYMSPEQAAGAGELDERSDLYALGCVLFELLAGRPPFVGPTAESIVHQQRTAGAPAVGSMRPGVPAELEHVVTRLLAKTPADRYRSAAEVTAALGAVPTPIALPRAPGRVSVPMLARALLAAVAVVAIGWGGYALVKRITKKAAPRQPTAVAVMPFTVRGDSGLAYLSEGMVTLLAATLDGAGDLRSVDARALLTFVTREKLPTGDTEAAETVAKRFGAGLVVMGDVVRMGDRVRMQADLYASASPLKRLATAEASGDPDSLTTLIDQLAAGLVSAREGGAEARLRRVAAMTTHSLPALKAYLEGEQAFRLSVFGRTSPAFQRALELDSTFALAWYRLSQCVYRPSPVMGRYDIGYASARRAVDLCGDLPARERDVVRAWHAWVRGETPQADSLYGSVVARYPDDIEAWRGLSDSRMYGNTLRGLPWRDAREPAEHILALDPNNANALYDVLYIAASQGDTAAADSFARRLLATAADPDDNLWQRANRAFYIGSAAQQESVAAEVRGARVSWMAELARNAVHVAFDVGRFEVAERALTLLDRADATVASVAPIPRLARGRWASPTVAPSVGSGFVAASVSRRAYLAACPLAPVPPDELRALRDSVEAVPAVDAYARTEFRWSGPAGFSPLYRAYLLGLLSVRVGDTVRALRHSQELDQMAGAFPEDAHSMARDCAASIRAAVLRRQGSHARALAELDRAPMRPWRRGTGGFNCRMHERFLRAELLHALGRDVEARPWYETAGDLTTEGIIYLAPAAYRLGEISEKEGKRQEAIRHYARFIELWEECDPSLRPMVEDARRRLSRLTAEPS